MIGSSSTSPVATVATVAVTQAHRDVSLEMLRAYVEVGNGGYWTVHAIAWSPDGRYWASAGADETLRIWDATTHRQLRVYTRDRLSGKVLDLIWSPDGRYIGVLAGGSSSRHAPACQVSVMDALTGEEVYRDANLLGSELAWLPAPCCPAPFPPKTLPSMSAIPVEPGHLMGAIASRATRSLRETANLRE